MNVTRWCRALMARRASTHRETTSVSATKSMKEGTAKQVSKLFPLFLSRAVNDSWSFKYLFRWRSLPGKYKIADQILEEANIIEVHIRFVAFAFPGKFAFVFGVCGRTWTFFRPLFFWSGEEILVPSWRENFRTLSPGLEKKHIFFSSGSFTVLVLSPYLSIYIFPTKKPMFVVPLVLGHRFGRGHFSSART